MLFSSMVLLQGFFTTYIGFKKGDPLSPYLFIILADVLRRNLNRLKLSRAICGVKEPTNILIETHEQFMDDIVPFGEVILSEAKAWKSLLDNYSNLSIQYIKFHKSKLLYFNTWQDIQRNIHVKLECQIHRFPNMYLGLPFTSEKPSHN